MKAIDVESVKIIHNIVIDETGGSPEIRDFGLLDSAVNSIFQTFGGEELYPTIIEKSSRLAYGIIKNHPFIDGNKRTGMQCMLVLLDINNCKCNITNSDVKNIGYSIADGSMTYEDIVQFLNDKSINENYRKYF